MRFSTLSTVIPLSILALSFSCPAATITFDDLTNFTSMSSVSPYNGLDWTNYTSYTSSGISHDGFPNGVVSQPGAVFSGGELGTPGNEITGTFTGHNGSTFTLNTAYLGAAYYNGEKVVVDGFNGVSLVFTQTLTLATTGAQKFSFEEANLTSVTITPVFGTGSPNANCGTFNCTQFTMDNLEINDPIPTAPEPGFLILPGIAVLGSAVMRRKLSR